MGTKENQLTAIAHKAIEYMTKTHPDKTREWCINRARKDSPGGENFTYNDVHKAVNDVSNPVIDASTGLRQDDVGTPVGHIELPDPNS